MEIFDLSTIITIAIAVFVFLRLRSVLGTRTGHEKRPMEKRRPQDSASAKGDEIGSNDNVVTLPTRNKNMQSEDEPGDEIINAIDNIAKPRTKLNKKLKEVAAADGKFEPTQFLSGAEMAYEMIVTAFADGDKKTLKNLLSKEVYEGFSGAIDQRKANGETMKSSFVGIDSASIVDADLIKNEVQITIRFVSEMITAIYDEKEDLVDGDPDQVSEVIDIWTFARDVRSRDPNWKLVATESGN